MSHHHAHHQIRHWSVWRSLTLLWTVAFAALVHRATSLGVVAALVVGFAIAATLVWIAYLITHRRGSDG